MSDYDVGDLIRCQGVFEDTTGTLRDPTAVTFKVKTPTGTTTTYTYGTDAQLVKDSTGTYHADVSITERGEWWFRFAGTGTYQGAKEDRFDVNLSRFP